MDIITFTNFLLALPYFVVSVSPNTRLLPIAIFDYQTSRLASITRKKGDDGDVYLEKFKAHFALDPFKVEDLVVTQDLLTMHMDKILQYKQASWKGSPCHQKIKNFLDENLRDINASKTVKDPKRIADIGDNPLFNFRLIHRVVSALLFDIVETCKGKLSIFDVVHVVLARASTALPTFKDLEDAVAGILRMQYIYGLTAIDIRRGILDGLETGATFSFRDCLVLAKAAIRMFEGEVLAYQWLLEASRIQSEEEYLASFIQPSELIEFEGLWKELLKLAGVKSSKELHKMLFGKRQETLKGLDKFEFYSTCRGETKMSLKMQAERFCYYEQFWDPYFVINPAKIEILSLHPVIFQIYNFVSDNEIDEIEKLSSATLDRFSIKDKNNWMMDAGMSSWINAETSPILTTFNKKIRGLAGVENIGNGETDLQVSLYSSMGYYAFQNDSNMDSVAATVLMFLSDVQMGGYISFPEVGIFVKPLKGSALLWYPSKENGHSSDLTLHGGCPVILGSQTIAKKWM